jgi:hypothetical protein
LPLVLLATKSGKKLAFVETAPVLATLVAAIVPVPEVLNDAPVPTVIAAPVFVPFVIAEKAGFPPVLVT